MTDRRLSRRPLSRQASSLLILAAISVMGCGHWIDRQVERLVESGRLNRMVYSQLERFPQLARFSQIESYVVFLELSAAGKERDEGGPESTAPSPSADGPKKPSFHKNRVKASEIFEVLLGKGNWQALQSRYGAANLLRHFDRGISAKQPCSELIRLLDRSLGDEADVSAGILPPIYIRGHSILVLYHAVSDAGRVLVEGSGRFFVIERKGADQRILLSGDTLMAPQVFKAVSQSRDESSRATIGEGMSDKSEFSLRGSYVVNRVPQEQVYYHSGETTMRVQLQVSQGDHTIFGIDYATDHEILANLRGHEEPVVIGKLCFEPGPGREILDLIERAKRAGFPTENADTQAQNEEGSR